MTLEAYLIAWTPTLLMALGFAVLLSITLLAVFFAVVWLGSAIDDLMKWWTEGHKGEARMVSRYPWRARFYRKGLRILTSRCWILFVYRKD